MPEFVREVLRRNPLGMREAAFLGAVTAKFVPDVVGHAEKDLHNIRIELTARPGADFLAGSLVGLLRAIGPIGGDGVKCISNRKDASAERNLITFQAARIAGAVIFFLMGIDDLSRFIEERNIFHDLVS